MDQAVDAGVTIGGEAMLAQELARAHAPGHDPSGACANCGATLAGAFCSACGQHGHVHRTAGALLHDLAHGVFHFEGRFWSTLPLLAWRPGELTRRYINGERARFVSPIALFLFSVFLLFAVVAHLPGWDLGDANLFNGGFGQGIEETRAKLAAERLHADERVANAQRRIARLKAATPDEDSADDLADATRDLAAARSDQAAMAKAQRYLPPPDVHKADTAEAAGENWFQTKYRHAKENPQLLLYKVKNSAYKYSWALIPISLPFIWLLFPFRRDVGLYDHAIFATYSLSFMSLLVVVLATLAAIGVPGAIVSTAGTFIPPFHIYRQLKGAYRLGRLGALWRTAWMLTFTVFTSTMFVILLVYLGTAD